MTYVFESKKPHLVFQVARSTQRQKGRSVEFLGHFFATDDDKIADSIMESGMYSEAKGEGQIWLRIKSEDEKELQKAKKRKPQARQVTSGPVGTS